MSSVRRNLLQSPVPTQSAGPWKVCRSVPIYRCVRMSISFPVLRLLSNTPLSFLDPPISLYAVPSPTSFDLSVVSAQMVRYDPNPSQCQMTSKQPHFFRAPSFSRYLLLSRVLYPPIRSAQDRFPSQMILSTPPHVPTPPAQHFVLPPMEHPFPIPWTPLNGSDPAQ